MKRVVVTGLGLLSSIGDNVDKTWSNLISGKSGIKKINTFDTSDLTSKIAGFISHDENAYEKSDLSNIVYSIKNTKNLPNINHINTLNYLGEGFGIPGIEINQLNIKKDDTVYLKLHSTKSSSISRMNDMLQNNNYFLSKVRSIQNISDQKTQMEIDLTLKEMK